MKNLHFDLIDGMQILGVEEPGNYAETVTLTNIPRYITEIWFDFEYLDTVKGNDFVTLRLLEAVGGEGWIRRGRAGGRGLEGAA